MSDPGFIRYLRDRLTATIEADPHVLLEHDGGPESLEAHLILATLYGIDEQVDHEWIVRRVQAELLAAIGRRATASVGQYDYDGQALPVARYKLQSSYATMKIDWPACRHLLPDDVRPDPGTYLATVALVRYRRH